jgi:dolichol-phosphate mannosyltransferase
MHTPTFSVIAPIFNEIENLPALHRRVSEVMNSTGESWELILVDDGSRDGSTDAIRALAAQDEHVRPVIFARNFGHQIAVTAGLDYSRGQAVVIIDADLQDPPEVILDLIAKWREGYEVVYAVRAEREGESWFKLFTASLFYRIIYRITDVKIPLDTGDFRLMDRKVVSVMNSMREHHRFLRGMSAWVGFKQIGVNYKRAARVAGETKYPLQENAAPGTHRHHGLFIRSSTASYDPRFCRCWAKLAGHSSCHHRPGRWQSGVLRAGLNPVSRTLPGWRATYLTRHSWRVHWSHL